MFMNEPKGKITIVTPTGKRMESINNLSEAIKANSEATVVLAKTIASLNPSQINITGVNIRTDGQSPAIHVSNEDEGLEQGVYHYSPTGYSEHDYGYPQGRKLNPNEGIPECYGEGDSVGENDDEEDETYEESVSTFDTPDLSEEELHNEVDFETVKAWVYMEASADLDLLIEKGVITKERAIEWFLANNE